MSRLLNLGKYHLIVGKRKETPDERNDRKAVEIYENIQYRFDYSANPSQAHPEKRVFSRETIQTICLWPPLPQYSARQAHYMLVWWQTTST